MATRDEFLRQVWDEVINSGMSGDWIDVFIENQKQNPDAPFADVGPVIERLLASGADRRDIAVISRLAAYETAFALLYMLDDPGVDDDDVFMLHESLLGADPSGMEGRPGSAP